MVGAYCQTELQDLQLHEILLAEGSKRDPLDRTNIIPAPSFSDQSLLWACV